MRLRTTKLALLAAVSATATLGLMADAHAAHVSCGTTITQNTTLDSDVGPCPGDGIIVGADGITLDLNGHQVFGVPVVPEGNVGVRLPTRTTVTVKGPGTVRDFDAGIAILGGSANHLRNLTVTNNVGSGLGDFGDGIAVNNSNDNLINRNTVTVNGPFSGVGVFGNSSGNTIRTNVITDNSNISTTHHGTTEQTDGVRLEPGTSNNLVIGNEVKRNGLDGIAVFAGSTNNRVRENTVEGNGFHLMTHRLGDGIRVFLTGNANLVKDNAVHSNAAHGIRVDSQNNSIITNTTSGNALFDLFDSQPNCDNNIWSGNTFLTASPACAQG